MTKNKILLGLLGLLFAHEAVFAQNIFYDNFSAGYYSSSNWTVLQGQWSVVGTPAGNALQNQSTSADSIIVTTASFPTNRIVTWNVKTITPGSNDWNVAVLYPKYIDSNHYISLILHEPDVNGNRALEIDQADNVTGFASGSTPFRIYIHNLPASLDPTIEHAVTAICSGNNLQITIDGVSVGNISMQNGVAQMAGSVMIDASQSIVQVFSVSVQNYNLAETVWVDDSVPSGANVSTYSGGNGGGPNVNAWTWVNNPVPYSGSLAIQAPPSSPISQVSFGTVAFPVNSGDILFAYVYLDPAHLPSEIELQYLYNNYGTWANAHWGASNITWGGSSNMGPIPTVTSAGWVRLEVPASLVGLGGQTVNAVALDVYGGGTAFWDRIGQAMGFAASAGSGGTITPSGNFSANYGNNQTFTFTPNAGYMVSDVQVDGVSQGPITSYTFNNVTSSHTVYVTFSVGGSTGDIVWVDDSVPSGANVSAYSGGNGGGSNVNAWTWVHNPAPYSGSLAIQAPPSSPISQISFGTVAFPVNSGDVLFAYVYLDPSNLPSEIELQYLYNNYGTWANAHWGAPNITWGGANQYIGPIPTITSAGWVRLEVPASLVGLGGQTVNAVALDVYGGGTVFWDYIGRHPGH